MAYQSPAGDGRGPTATRAHLRRAPVQFTRWGVWASTLVGVVATVTLITLTAGVGSAHPDVPAVLQVGSRVAAPSTVATGPVGRATSTTSTTSSTSTTAAVTRPVPVTTTTATRTLTIVTPRSRVTEGPGGADESAGTGATTTGTADH